MIWMDNLNFHHKISVPVSLSCRVRLAFTPPYTPEANPIEEIFRGFKLFLHKIGWKNLDDLDAKA